MGNSHADQLRAVARARAARDVGGAVTTGGSGFDPTVPTRQTGAPMSLFDRGGVPRPPKQIGAPLKGWISPDKLKRTRKYLERHPDYHPGDDTRSGA